MGPYKATIFLPKIRIFFPDRPTVIIGAIDYRASSICPKFFFFFSAKWDVYLTCSRLLMPCKRGSLHAIIAKPWPPCHHLNYLRCVFKNVRPWFWNLAFTLFCCRFLIRYLKTVFGLGYHWSWLSKNQNNRQTFISKINNPLAWNFGLSEKSFRSFCVSKLPSISTSVWRVECVIRSALSFAS